MDSEPGPRAPEPQAEEADLVERFRRRRDGAAFEALYRGSRRTVFSVCLHFLREQAWAEDACQDVFVQAYERFDSLKGDRFTAWVRRIAAHHCLNLLRHRAVTRRLAPQAVREGETTAPPESGAVEARQELARAAAVLRSLSFEQRRVFLLRHIEDLGPREITEVTGYTAGQVRSYLQNARRNFRLGWGRQEAERRGTNDGTIDDTSERRHG